MHRVTVTCLAWLLLCASGPALATDRIAVMELAAKSGIKQAQLDVLSDMLATEIRNLGGYEVVTRSDIESMLGLEKAKELIGCDDASCLAEIGGALGVAKMVTGNVGAFGTVFAVNLKIIDIKRARVENSTFSKVKGGEAALLDAIPNMVRGLLGKDPAAAAPPAAPPPSTSQSAPPPPRDSPPPPPAPPAGELLSEDELKGRDMYLRYNLRYQKKGRASCVNYLEGTIVPAGTAVHIKDLNRKRITLTTADGQEVLLDYREKYTRMPVNEWVQMVMSFNDPRGEWGTFSALERDGITNGMAVEGMSKAAVLVAMGWPPAHRTRSLDEDGWRYWRTRGGQIMVYFENGRVVQVGGKR